MIDPSMYVMIEPHLRDALIRYVCLGHPPGSFLQAVLSNKLVESAGYADSHNIYMLHVWASVMHNVVPSPAHGSAKAVESWCEDRAIDPCSPDSVDWPDLWMPDVDRVRGEVARAIEEIRTLQNGGEV